MLTTIAVGGLTEVGFGDDSDLLLTVSFSGRAVLNCSTGERVARDREDPNETWYDERRLRALGIGPLAGRWLRLAGLHGGGLPKCGAAGYWVEAVTLEWPEAHLLLGGPWGSLFDPKTPIVKLAIEREVRAFGFSDSGRTIVVATASDVAVLTYAD